MPPRLLVLISPPGPEGFFTVVDAQFPSQAGPPDPSAIGALAASYGIRIVRAPTDGEAVNTSAWTCYRAVR